MAGAVRFKPIAGHLFQEGFSDLATCAVVGADEQNASFIHVISL
jgi:hypothetical protein